MELNITAPINQLGYGQVGINLTVALSKLGHSISLFPVGSSTECSPAHQEILKQCVKNSETYNYNGHSLKIWHQFQLADAVGRGMKTAMTIFELDKLRPNEVHHINGLDILFVNSEWAKQVCKKSGVMVPVEVVPLGVDRSIFHENLTPDNDITNEAKKNGTTVFLTMGKWEYRKGHDIVIDAFNEAFEPSDNVSLVACCHNPFIGEKNQEWENYYMSGKMGEKVFVIRERLPTQIQVAELMASCDCGVFLSRAEGWNLELLEMLSCGKYCITTNYSGHTQFVHAGNCYLVPGYELEDAIELPFFNGFGRWMKFTEGNFDEVVSQMRRVHKFKQDYDQIYPNKTGIETAKQFTWDNSARILASFLEKYEFDNTEYLFHTRRN